VQSLQCPVNQQSHLSSNSVTAVAGPAVCRKLDFIEGLSMQLIQIISMIIPSNLHKIDMAAAG